MANETTSTTLTEIVNSEWIEDAILDYAIDLPVISKLVRYSDLADKASATASFPAWEKDAGSDVSEGSDFSNVALQTTETATISAAMVGVLREVTEFAARTNKLGPEGLLQMVLEDGAKLCTEMLEDDLAALFSSAGTTVGTTGSDLTIANFVQAIASLDTNKARGRKVCVLDDQQANDLRAAVASSTATVFGNAATGAQSVLNARSDAFVGELFGVPVWLTNLTDTANTGADVVGCMMIDGMTNPKNAPIGVAWLWSPMVKTVADAATVSDHYTISQAHGVGEISDFNYVGIVTDA